LAVDGAIEAVRRSSMASWRQRAAFIVTKVVGQFVPLEAEALVAAALTGRIASRKMCVAAGRICIIADSQILS